MERLAYNPKQFCERAGFSLAHLYRLWRNSEGPRSFKVGERRLISHAEADDWLRRMTETGGVKLASVKGWGRPRKADDVKPAPKDTGARS